MTGTNLSLTGKIIGLIIMTVLIVGGATFGSAFYFLSKGYDEQAEKEIAMTSKMIQANFDDLKEKVKGLCRLLAGRPDVAAAVEKKDTAYLQNLGKTAHGQRGARVRDHRRQGRKRHRPGPFGQNGRQRHKPDQREEGPGRRDLRGRRGGNGGEALPPGGGTRQDRRPHRGDRHPRHRPAKRASVRRRYQEALRRGVHHLQSGRTGLDDPEEGRQADRRDEDGQPEGDRNGPPERADIPQQKQDPGRRLQYGLLADHRRRRQDRRDVLHRKGPDRHRQIVTGRRLGDPDLGPGRRSPHGERRAGSSPVRPPGPSSGPRTS